MKNRLTGIFDYLSKKWGIKSRWQLAIICIVFAITGSLSVKVASPVLNFIGLEKGTMSAWLYYPLRILAIFPVYQVLLIIIGTLFGQFRFFWQIEKKMLSRMLPFLFKKEKATKDNQVVAE